MGENKDSKERSRNVEKNIVYSFILKAIGVGLSFLLIPLSVHYLTEVEYGVWGTLFSVMNWVNLLDMGIGLGLRNKLAEAVARHDLIEIKRYMATGMISMLFLGVVILILFIVGIQFITLQNIYNTTLISEDILYRATFWTGIFVIITFVLSVVNQFYYAWQEAAKTGAINILHNFIMLVFVYWFTLQSNHSILYFVFSFGIASLTSRVYFLIGFFRRHKGVFPKYQYVRISYIRNIVNLGIKFFVIQIAVVCLFSSSNILITQRLGPEHILAYDVVFKIFSIITIIHGIISTPLWNAYTEAYVKKDYFWMKNTMEKMLILMIPVFLSCVLLVFLTPWLIENWIHKQIVCPDYLTFSAALFVFISCFNNVWVYLLNGIGKISLQMYLSILSAVIVIPLGWYMMSDFDSSGMLLAIDGCLMIGTVPMMMQVKNFFNKHIRINSM